MTLTNPLFAFRAPAGLKNHPHLDGDYLNTKRQDVENDTGAFNIYPGMFAYKPDRTLEVDLAIWEDLDDQTTARQLYNMTTHEGFEVCQSDQWEVVDPIAQDVWKPAAGGKLTFLGRATKCAVLMWRTGEEAERRRKSKLRNIEYINKTPQEKQQEMQARLGPLNASVSVTLEDDGETTDEAMANYERRLATKGL